MKIFDSHFHVIDPQFPLTENNGYLPPAFTVDNYQAAVKDIDIVGGALVSGSFQKFDQQYLINALRLLGEDYFGVANIPIDLKNDELEELDKLNICAVRFNLKRGGSEGLKHMVSLSNKLYDKYGWHSEIYIDSKDLKALKKTLKQIPRFSIDHLGLTKAGLTQLYYWAEMGVKIKASGFGRLDFDPIPVMKTIYSINPESLMFGTDLPSTRAKEPFKTSHLKSLQENFTEEECQKIVYQNARNWYAKNKG